MSIKNNQSNMEPSMEPMVILTDYKIFNPDFLNLMASKNHGLVESILENSLEVPTNLIDNTGSTLLHHAAACKNIEIACYLRELGCKLDTVNKAGHTPLTLAMKSGKIDLVKYFCESVDTHETKSNVKHFARVIDMMLRLSRDESRNEFEMANVIFDSYNLSHIDNKVIAQIFIVKQCPLYYAILLNKVEVVEIMLKDGISVNKQNPFNGNSPLHIAVNVGNLNMVRLLVEYGASVSSVNHKNQIPLNREKPYFSRDGLKILKILVDKGSPLTSRDNKGYMQTYNIFKNANHTAINIILESNVNLNAQDLHGDTMWHYSLITGNSDVLSLIIKYDFNPNIMRPSGSTILHHLAFKHELTAMRLLLDYGANVNVKSVTNEPPLHFIFLSGLKSNIREFGLVIKCVRALIVEYSADIQYVANDGITILELLHEYQDDLLDIVFPRLALLEKQGTIIIKELCQKIENTEWMKKHLDACRAQLEELKLIEIQSSVTMFKIVTGSEMTVVSYMRNKELVAKTKRLLKSSRNIHWLYVEMTKRRVATTLKIIQLQPKAAVALRKLFRKKTRFADIVANEVMVHLSLEDLENLISIKFPMIKKKK